MTMQLLVRRNPANINDIFYAVAYLDVSEVA
jgi:hypothetical protein